MVSTALAPTPPASSVGADATSTNNTRHEPSPSNNSTAAPASSVARQMRLKVSYTFDEENKSNCLARWPHLVSTPVVQVDPELLVGAVELKTCILSIISASPELVATLSQDYSVYAYDLSEPGFPLVGCGMLSWAMLNTQNSSTRIMVTGRVSCNTFGFFTDDGIKETLEVKFRLQKVDTFTQEQFVKSVHAYTALSRQLPGDFDASAWSNFVNAHPHVLEKSFAAPAQIQHTVQPAPELVRLQQALPAPVGWQNGQTPTEDIVQPPKKRQRTATKRAPRIRKKPGNTTSSPADLPGSEQPPPVSEDLTMEDTRQAREVSAESSRFLKPSMSRELLALSGVEEVSPSNMASSPPGGEEAGDGGDSQNGPSPAPTSPCLPLLPSVRPEIRTLETLYEEPEPGTGERSDVPHSCTGLILPMASQQQNPFIMPATGQGMAAMAAGSPGPSEPAKAPKKPRRRTKKDAAVTSDAVAPSSDAGYDSSTAKQKAINKTRTAKHVKERIELQLMEAIKKGMMPNYCRNCGAIETAVWRRVRVPDDQNPTEKDKPKEADTPGQEPKEEERSSTEPESQTLKEKDDKDKEIMLCNACGLWFLSHQTMRPQQLWDAKAEPTKPTNSRKRKKSTSATAPTPPTSSAIADSIVAEPIILPDNDDDDDDATPRQASTTVRRAAIVPSGNRSSTKNANDDWNSAITESRRIAQSSPVVAGSVNSPIDLDADIDGTKSPRRLLFPSARKPATTAFNSEKENLPPSSSQETIRDIPKTPTRTTRARSASFHLRTPLRSASRLHLSPRRSASRPPPATPERRLLKSHRPSISPTAGLLEKLLAADDTINSPDFAEYLATNTLIPNLSFDIDDGFRMHTDLTMPSSPPAGFSLFEDQGLEGADWSDFLPSTPGGGFELYDGGVAGGHGGLTVDLSAFIEEHTGGMGTVREEEEEEGEE